MRRRIRIVVDGAHEVDLPEALERIADAVAGGDERGSIEVDGGIAWDVATTGDGVAIDRRQRVAAATLLVGFDLPQEMRAASLSFMEAAGVCPGLTAGELPQAGPDGRRKALEAARAIVDGLLAEIPATADRP